MEDDARDAKYRAFCFIKGDMGVAIVRQKCFSKLPKGVKLIDGHKPFTAKNLKPIDGREPCHLDIVGINNKKEVTFICEVKTTVTLNREFEANGYCMAFMKEAQEIGIPIYFSIVRLDRDFNHEIVKDADMETGRVRIDRELMSKEIGYAMTHAKVELYKQNEFRMNENRFLI